MKQIRLINWIASTFLIVLLGIYPQTYVQEIRVMTYNIRVDFGGDGPNNWEFRRDILANQIQNVNPDLLGIQEGKRHQVEFLRSKLSGYSSFGKSRDATKDDEYCTIFYKNDKFQLLQDTTIWLSPTPEIPSKGWDADLPRIATVGKFRELKTGKEFFFLNTHLDHKGKLAQSKGVETLLEFLKRNNPNNLPVVISGDFNVTDQEMPYQLMHKHYPDSRLRSKKTSGSLATFNAFQNPYPNAQRIDFIFTSDSLEVLNHNTPVLENASKYPSDHFPVWVDLKFTL